MQITKKILGVAIGLAISGTALAQGNFYGGIEGGSAGVTDQTGQVASALVNSVGGSVYVTQDKSVGIFRVFGGYNFNPMVAVELGYAQSGNVNFNFSGVSGSNVRYAGTGTESFDGLDLSGILHPILLGPGSGLFVRAGLSDYTEKADVTAYTQSSYGYSSSSQSGTGENLGVGYDFDLGMGTLRTELTFSQDIAGDSSSKATSLMVGYYW